MFNINIRIGFLKSTLCTCLFFMCAKIIAQNDTIYYDAKWKESTKQEASFFRPPITKKGDLFSVKDYYISGQVQMNATSTSSTKDIWEGEVTWYKEDGSMYQTANYKNKRLEGDFITFSDGEKLVAKYENGYLKSGRILTPYGSGQWYKEKKGDSLVEIIFDKNKNGIRYENYSTVKDGNYLSKYYGKDGVLIGNRELMPNGYVKGVEVFYSYNPMKVKQIIYSPFGQQLITAYFFENGQVREEVIQGDRWSKKFYNREGKILGTIAYELDRNYLKPHNGTEINYAYVKNKVDGSILSSATVYEKGVIQEQTIYHDNNEIKSITKYKNGSKLSQVSFDEKGNEIARITYKDYRPFDGIETGKDRMATYKQGKMIEEISFYRDTKIPLRKLSNSLETYYDKKGNILGKLKVKLENNYSQPWEGERYSINNVEGEIFNIVEYKDGKQIKNTRFTKKLVETDIYKTFKEVLEYDSDGFTKTKEISFYSNEKKQSEIFFKGYEKQRGIFYDDQEKEIGKYDFINKDGKLYQFFDRSDLLEKEEVYKDGELMKSKVYILSRNTDYRDIKPILVSEMDVDCCATFYTDTGSIIGKLSFKNQKPWEGLAYDRIDRVSYEIEDGKRNGTYKKLDYNEAVLEEGQFVNDNKEGLFKYYTYLGVLKKTEQFKNGKLNGTSTYFNDKGDQIAQMNYESGKPMDGTILLNQYKVDFNDQETYKNGLITQRIRYNREGKEITDFENGTQAATTVYFKDSDIKKLKYTLKNNYLDGDVIRYDETGKEQYKAQFTLGKFESGTVLLTSSDYSNTRVSHLKVSMSNNQMMLLVVDIEGKSIFKAEESLIMGSSIHYMDKLNIGLNYLSPSRLY